MANILDYIAWRGDLSWKVSPFNEVDNLLFAELSYIDFSGIVPPPDEKEEISLAEAGRWYFDRHRGTEINLGVLVSEKIPDLFRAMPQSERYRDVKLSGFVNEIDEEKEQQFAAVTAELGDGSVYVAFRGTDDTIVGWKEDLNLS